MPEREWREAIDMRSSLVSIGLVVLAAALLRFIHLRQPWVTPLEAQIIDPTIQLLRTGSYRPAALARPTLPVYVQTAVAVVHFLIGAVTGAWRSLDEFGPSQIVGWGRSCSAIVGTAVVVLVYQIGMRWGARHALLASGLMAVTPMHVGVSREIGDGALLTFFAALTLLLSLVAIERVTRRTFAWAGLAVGLAAASHYAGALLIVVPLVAAWMTPSDESRRTTRALAAVGAALVAFVATTPLAIGDLPAFLNGFADAASPLTFGAGGRVDLIGQLVSTLQLPGLLLALAGIALALMRAVTGPGHTRWTLLVSFPIVYFAVVAWHGATSETILLPLVPALALLAANAVVSGVSQLRRFDIPRAARTALIAALTVIALLPPTVFSIELVRQSAREPMRARAVAEGYRGGR